MYQKIGKSKQVSDNRFQVINIKQQVTENNNQVESIGLQISGCKWNQEKGCLFLF